MKNEEARYLEVDTIPSGGMSFEAFFRLTEQLAVAEMPEDEFPYPGKKEVIRLNYMRMKRTMAKIDLPEHVHNDMQRIENQRKWVVLAEPWCSDAAHIVPLLAKIADINPNIHLEIFLRDKHPELMDRYLTNGTRSIPKMVCFSEDQYEVGHWGPRPESLTDHIKELKEIAGLSGDELKAKIQVWYNNDRGKSFIHEFCNIVSGWENCRQAG